MQSLKYFIPLSFILSLLLAGPAWSQGEHTRRVAAELLILFGDLRKLTASPPQPAPRQKGLRGRIIGGLAGLAILMRLADQELGRPPQMAKSITGNLRAAFKKKNFTDFKKLLSGLIARYPLKATGILPATATPARLARAKELHETICAGCHDEPDKEVERPAYNLFSQARRLSPPEFTARMIIGVRGDRITGLGNPLTDEEIAALISYYQSSQP